MKTMWSALMLVFAMSLAVVVAADDSNRNDNSNDDGNDNRNGGRGIDVFRARLVGVQEVPSISTPARGSFRARVDEDSGMITYWLTYEDLEAPVQQAHLHLGERHTNGGISVFLCSNLDNGPPGTQACPSSPAEVTGTIMATEVIGPEGQGITSGEFAELVAAIHREVVYANVHTELFPSGEIRGQLRR